MAHAPRQIDGLAPTLPFRPYLEQHQYRAAHPPQSDDGLIHQIDLEIQLPPDFPEKYKAAVIRSAEQCAVEKHLEHPPTFNVTTSTVEAAAAQR